MSIPITINDTHAAVQRLIAKGADKELAEEIVATVRAATVEREPATKSDISDLRAELYRALLIHGFVVVVAVVGSAVGLLSLLGQHGNG